MASLSEAAIAELLEFGESTAWSNYYTCTPPEFASAYGVQARRLGSLYLTMIPGLDWSFFNRIVCLGIQEPATEAMLDESIGILTASGCSNYMVQLHPKAQPPSVTDWLRGRGFSKGSNWAKCIRGDEPATPVRTSLRIEEVGPEHAEIFDSVVLTAFEMPSELAPMISGPMGQPGWHHYLAFDGLVAAAAAAMYVSGQSAWFGFGSTLSAYRQRGAQSALFARRIEDGRALGAKWFITETGEDTPKDPNPSYRNMLRSGFELAYMRRNWVVQTAGA